jgi:hypothetical protein
MTKEIIRECLVFQAADMDKWYGDPWYFKRWCQWRNLLGNGRNGGDDCAASQDANRNNELMHSETSKSKENKEAMVDMEVHDTSSSVIKKSW